MEVLPAIDLRGGRVVRLSQGDYARQQVYSTDPGGVAGEFAAAGARWIHVIDLDAARWGRRANADGIRAICRTGGVSVELGGGIRDDRAVRDAFDLGVDRVIVGTAALKDWGWFEKLASDEGPAGKVALALDGRAGRLAAEGWTSGTDLGVEEVARRAGHLPLAAVIYTDIERDGMLVGPDLETTARLVELTGLPVIASGGVSGIEDVAACIDIGCAGVIIGRAYYEGRIDLAAACELAAGRRNP